MKRLGFVLFGVGCLALVGCNNNDTTGGDGGVKSDGQVAQKDSGVSTDTAISDAASDGGLQVCPADSIGKPCTKDEECGGGAGVCLGVTQTSGICSCECTPDDPKTEFKDEDSCPDQSNNLCVSLPLQNGSTLNRCFHKCAPKLGESDCQAPFACQPRSASITMGDSPVCVFSGCKTDADCPVSTGVACSVAQKNCPTGQTCEALVTGSDNGQCFDSGKCDTVSGLCAPHTKGKTTAKVGDACKSDLECGNNMVCFEEQDLSKILKKAGEACTTNADCCSDKCDAQKCTAGPCFTNNRNGYCIIAGCQFATTLTDYACPEGSTCNRLYTGGLCQKACDMTKAETCRGNASDLYGDYECRGWNNLSITGPDGKAMQISDAPVCDFGLRMPCDFFGAANLECSVIGFDSDPQTSGVENTTNMGCRNIFTGAKTTDPKDPTGFCMDDSASGTNKRPAQ